MSPNLITIILIAVVISIALSFYDKLSWLINVILLIFGIIFMLLAKYNPENIFLGNLGGAGFILTITVFFMLVIKIMNIGEEKTE